MKTNKLFATKFLQRTGHKVSMAAFLTIALLIIPTASISGDDALSKLVAKISCDKVKEMALNAPGQFFAWYAENNNLGDGAGIANQIIKSDNISGLLDNLGDALTVIQAAEEAMSGTPENVAKILAAEVIKKSLEKLGKFAGTGAPGAVWQTLTLLNDFAVALNEEILDINIRTTATIAENDPKILGDGGVEYYLKQYLDSDMTRSDSFSLVKRRAFLIEYATIKLGIKNFPGVKDWNKNWNQVRSVTRAFLNEVNTIVEKRTKFKKLQGELRGKIAQLRKEIQVVQSFNGLLQQVKAMTCTELTEDDKTACLNADLAVKESLESVILDAGDIERTDPGKISSLDSVIKKLSAELDTVFSGLSTTMKKVEEYCKNSKDTYDSVEKNLATAKTGAAEASSLQTTAKVVKQMACDATDIKTAELLVQEAKNTVDEANKIVAAQKLLSTDIDKQAPPLPTDFAKLKAKISDANNIYDELATEIREALVKQQKLVGKINTGKGLVGVMADKCVPLKILSPLVIEQNNGRFDEILLLLPDIEADAKALSTLKSSLNDLNSRTDALEKTEKEVRECLGNAPDVTALIKEFKGLVDATATNLEKIIADANEAEACLKALKEKCEPNEELDDTGECICKNGFEDVDGNCEPECGQNEKRNNDGKCVCQDNFEEIDGKCVTPCNADEERNAEGDCIPICGQNEERNSDGKCVCISGFEKSDDGSCQALADICTSDSDCLQDSRCNTATGKCEPRKQPPCTSDRDCPEGYDCNRGTGECEFQKQPPCTSDRDCPEGYDCNKGTGECEFQKQPDCTTDDDCPTDYECNTATGECVFKKQPSCTIDSDCPVDYECDTATGECVFKKQPSCTSDSDCPIDYQCDTATGECVFQKQPDCTSDSDCPVDYECNTATGECQYQKKTGCKTDIDCPKGYGCNSLTGECVFEKEPPCTSDGDCSTGYTCNTSTGDCIFTKMPGCSEIGCPDGYECNVSTDECQYVKAPGCQETGCPEGYECNQQSGECQYVKQLGCQGDFDCAVGYVCNTSSGQCISPFDENYTNFGGTLTGKDDDRNQDNVDQATSDNQATGSGTKFTSSGLDSDIKNIEEEIKNLPGKPPVKPPSPPSKPPPAEPPPETPPDKPPEPPAETPPPATSTGIDIVEVGTAPPGQCKIVNGQLVPVKGYKEKIAGMTLTLSGAVNQTTTSSGSGSFNFQLIPAGDYVIAVSQWNYGMTKQSFTAPSGKAIKITLKGSCPYLYVWNGENYEKENDIYSVARIFPAELMSAENQMYADRDGLFLQQVSVDNISEQLIKERSYKDYYQISKALKADSDGHYRLMVREQASERSFSDLFELWAVDHQSDTQIGTTRSGRLFLYNNLNHLTSWPGEENALYNGDSVEIKMPAEAFGTGVVAIDWQGFQDGPGAGQSAGKGRPRISLERMDPSGTWQTIDWAYPRDEQQKSFFILDDLGSGWDGSATIRLTALSCEPDKFHQINRVSWGPYSSGTPKSSRLSLVSAVKSDNEDVGSKTLRTDGKSVFLAPEEEVKLRYQAIPLPEGMKRTFIFVSQGVYIPMPMIRIMATNQPLRPLHLEASGVTP